MVSNQRRSRLLESLTSLEGEGPDAVISMYVDLSQPELATPRAVTVRSTAPLSRRTPI